MSISKVRGKSAISQNESKLTKSYVPATASLLKIEPFVPTLTTRFRKPFHRSYSTLSTTYLKRTTEPKTRQSRHTERNLLTRQRSRSSLSSSLSSSQNGGVVCRINRQQKEQEKLPDRINYDRRGLTSIPVFENEQNLRLLSLQHNLINIFHVPDQNVTNNKNGSGNCNNNIQNSILEEEEEEPVEDNNNSDNVIKLQRNSALNKRNLTISPTIPSVLPENLSLTGTNQQNNKLLNNNHINNNISINNSVNNSNNNNNNNNNNANILTNCNNSNNLIKNSFVQKSVLLHAHQKYSLKKSKSFITNYSKHFGSIKQNLQKCSILTPASFNSGGGGGGGVGGSSGIITYNYDGATNFYSNELLNGTTTTSSSSPVSEILNENVKGLKVKNNQLMPSYGIIFNNLVFLDLYDNQIEKISNLDGLKSLTVLLLGKNRITDISGLTSLKNTLRVLDLHGNKITNLSNKINCLQELKSLNLAGNLIRQINQNDFAGLLNLKELNLKRNKIKRVLGFNHLNNLERLWLCHNELHKVEDMSSIAKAIKLQEVSIESNPVSLAGDCVSFLVSYLPNLIMLSQMPITDQVRRAAMAWRKNKETSDANYSNLTSDVSNSIRREEVISNARTNWELLRSQQILNSTSSLATFTGLKPGNSPAFQQLSPFENENKPIMQDIENNSNNSCHNGGVKLRKAKLKGDDKQNINNIINNNSNKNDNDIQELFRLPPILKPYTNSMPSSSEKTHSSGSSLGPNIDSSSSCFSSDTEDKDHVQANGGTVEIRVSQPKETTNECENLFYELPAPLPPPSILHHPTNTTIMKDHPGIIDEHENPETSSNISSTTTNTEISSHKDCLPSLDELTKNLKKPASIILGNNIDNNSDKISNISITSLRSESEISSTAVGLAERASAKPKPSTANRRYMQGSLVRSQTAKPRTSAYNNNNSISNTNNNNNNNNNNNITSNNNNNNNNNNIAKATKTIVEREREQGGDYLIEICGRYLNIYGLGALRFIDKQWNSQKSSDVHTLNFSYINFNSITTILCRIKFRFPNAESFVFRETNINTLGQLNSLAELQGITSLVIDSEGNFIYNKDWRLYAIYRLSHWGLKSINGIEITESEVDKAQVEYSGLSDLVLWSLPESLLQPLLTRLRLDENCSASKLSAKEWLMKADQSLKVVVGKEALQWKRTNTNQDDFGTRDRGKMHFSLMIENTCNAVEKLQQLETLWPNLLLDIIKNTLFDYSQLDVYLKDLMSEVMK